MTCVIRSKRETVIDYTYALREITDREAERRPFPPARDGILTRRKKMTARGVDIEEESRSFPNYRAKRASKDDDGHLDSRTNRFLRESAGSKQYSAR